MNRKKTALRALAVLAIVIALCMFFARTIQTITTPKIQRINATKGKLEQKISLTGELYFPSTQEVFVKDAKKMALSVDTLLVRPGYYVEAGDVIFTAAAPDYESKLKELKANYDKKVREITTNRAASIRTPSSSIQNTAYNAMLATGDAYYDARYALMAAALLDGYTLPADEEAWAAVTDAPEKTAEALKSCLTAKETYHEAFLNLRRIYTTGADRVGDNTFEFVKKMDGYYEELNAIQADMLALETLRDALTTVRAPHAGYITAVSVKVGDSYDGSKSAYSISAEGTAPTLRAEITNVDKTIAEGNKVELDGGAGAKVASVQVDADGKKYALIDLTGDLVKSLGGMSKLVSQASVSMTLTYKASRSTTLLPASAVRSEGENSYYVYVVNRNYGGLLGNAGYTVKKTTVTVLEKSDKMVSLSDDLSYMEVADREDRALSDGQAVMDYVD